MKATWFDRFVVIFIIALASVFILGSIALVLSVSDTAAIAVIVIGFLIGLVLYWTSDLWDWKPITPEQRLNFLTTGKAPELDKKG